MSVYNSLEQLRDIAEKKGELHSRFIRQILVMASTLFGILVSLHRSPESLYYARLSFSVALCTLSLGVVLLSISLFAEVAAHKDLLLKKKEDILRQLDDVSHTPEIIVSNTKKYFSYCEIIGYCSLLLSAVSLAIYATLIA